MVTQVASMGVTKLLLIHLFVLMLTPWVWTIKFILALESYDFIWDTSIPETLVWTLIFTSNHELIKETSSLSGWGSSTDAVIPRYDLTANNTVAATHSFPLTPDPQSSGKAGLEWAPGPKNYLKKQSNCLFNLNSSSSWESLCLMFRNSTAPRWYSVARIQMVVGIVCHKLAPSK